MEQFLHSVTPITIANDAWVCARYSIQEKNDNLMTIGTRKIESVDYLNRESRNALPLWYTNDIPFTVEKDGRTFRKRIPLN